MQSSIYGYTITPTHQEKGAAYILERGRRRIGLMRNRKNPKTLFTVNLDNFTKPGKIHGHDWFTDAGGELQPIG